MKRAFLGLLLVVFVITTSCDSEVPYTELESGFGYKYIENAEGKKAVQGDLMMIDLKAVYDGDSVMIERGGDDKLPLNPFAGQMGGFQEVLNLCGEGDSVHVRMKLMKYVELTRAPVTPDMDTSKYVTMRMRIAEVENESTILARMKEEQVALDEGIIQKYITDEGLNAVPTAQGIYQVVITEGNGPKPENGQTVSVDYAVRLLDGTLLDTSYENVAKENGMHREGRQYQPYTFVLGTGNAITGWHVGLPFVNKGGKSKLLIPSGLAYGQRGRPGIPPNAVLVFDLEVVDIK